MRLVRKRTQSHVSAISIYPQRIQLFTISYKEKLNNALALLNNKE